MKTTERFSIFISFIIISSLGSILIGRACFALNIPEQAIWRGVVFVTVMAAVHAAGALYYAHQYKIIQCDLEDDWANVRDPLDALNPSPKKSSVQSSAIDLRYRSALKTAFAEQAITLLLTSPLLDFGELFRIALIAAAAHSTAVLMIVLARPVKPSRFDLWIMEYGYFIAIFFVLIADMIRYHAIKVR